MRSCLETAHPVYRAVDRMGLQGMVSKARASTYRSGPTMLWRKIKCYETGYLEIIGVERERGKVPVALFNKGGAYVGSLPSASRSRRAAVAKIRCSTKRSEERSVVYWG